MRDESQWMAARTIDLGYEQLLVVEDQRGSPVGALYRGVWLTRPSEPGRQHADRDATPAARVQRPSAIAQWLDRVRDLLSRPQSARHLRSVSAPLNPLRPATA